MADDDKTPESEGEKIDPWGRIETIVRKVMGEELSKWETESPNSSQPSGETPETSKETPAEESKSSPPTRKMGFLSKAFGIQE